MVSLFSKTSNASSVHLIGRPSITKKGIHDSLTRSGSSAALQATRMRHKRLDENDIATPRKHITGEYMCYVTENVFNLHACT